MGACLQEQQGEERMAWLHPGEEHTAGDEPGLSQLCPLPPKPRSEPVAAQQSG